MRKKSLIHLQMSAEKIQKPKRRSTYRVFVQVEREDPDGDYTKPVDEEVGVFATRAPAMKLATALELTAACLPEMQARDDRLEKLLKRWTKAASNGAAMDTAHHMARKAVRLCLAELNEAMKPGSGDAEVLRTTRF